MPLIENFLYPPHYEFKKQHLTQIKNLSEFDIAKILDHALMISNMTEIEKLRLIYFLKIQLGLLRVLN